MRNTFTKRTNRTRGISIVEVLVVIAVLAMIFSVVVPQFGEMRARQVLKSAVSDILSTISKAKGATLASVDSSSYGVHFKSGEVIIFKGTVFSEGHADNEIMEIVSPARISNVTLGGSSGTSGSLYFNRLTGSPDRSGTVTVTTGSLIKTITISATGSANSN